MGTISVFQNVTLDGVMQAPGRPDEDPRGGFRHGGWAQGYSDDVAMELVGGLMGRTVALLFGRRTYEDLLGYWTTRTDPNPFSGMLVDTPKYVVSTSSETTLGYPNSTLLAGDGGELVADLRRLDGVITVMGSGVLVRSLHAAGQVDTYLLQVHPLLLGAGTRLFGDGERTDLQLVRSTPTTTGVLVAEYAVDHADRG